MTFREHLLNESIEKDITKEVVSTLSTKVSKSFDDDFVSEISAKIRSKIEQEFADKEPEEPEASEGEEEIEDEETPNEDNAEDETEDLEAMGLDSEDVVDKKDEIDVTKLPKEDQFLVKLSNTYNIELKDLLDMWEKAKKQSKFDIKDNGYWNDVDKIFKEMIYDEYNIESR
jgi:hypothetical protein